MAITNPTVQEYDLPVSEEILDTDYVRKVKKNGDLSELISYEDFRAPIETAAEEASAESAAAAKISEDNAKTSETNAGTSETNAATSASNALTSEQNAKTSEDNAKDSEDNASDSAGTATTQAGIATTQAGIATTQAGISTTKASEASDSASAANTSKNYASGYADTALQAKNDAEAAAQLSIAGQDLTIQNIGNVINSATAKTDLADADQFPVMDSADGNKLKKWSWARLKQLIPLLNSYNNFQRVTSNPASFSFQTGFTHHVSIDDAGSKAYYGVFARPEYTLTAATHAERLLGFEGALQFYGDGTVDNVIGTYGGCDILGSSHITNHMSIWACGPESWSGLYPSMAPVITNSIGVQINSPFDQLGGAFQGTIANLYGIRANVNSSTSTSTTGLFVYPYNADTGSGGIAGIYVEAIAGTSSGNNYGVRIVGVTTASASKNNYGLYIGAVSGGGTNYAVYTDGGNIYHKACQMTVLNTTAPQIIASGYSQAGAASNGMNGCILFGTTAANQGRVDYDSTGNTFMSIDNTYDNASAMIRFRLRTAGTAVTPLAMLGSGKVGIMTTSPTAYLHLPASTAAANTASLKITPGVVATIPVSGNIESDGTHLYWTDSAGNRKQLDN